MLRGTAVPAQHLAAYLVGGDVKVEQGEPVGRWEIRSGSHTGSAADSSPKTLSKQGMFEASRLFDFTALA